ncbi:synaptic vesicular amine transporter-like [Myripristis murdjan]|uniref:synaptic vesicular amine transporter-like n=1 Tax=Myripristis murdjan TaxID=586833 RepID=UPI001175E882|nr:synaptic vesicular amine transporter-like [Myripristis murdjan]
MEIKIKSCEVKELGFLAWLRQEAQQKKMVMVVVFIALLLDNMLLSVVVPILPIYLYTIDQLAMEAAENNINLSVGSSILWSVDNSSVDLNFTFTPPSLAPSTDSSIRSQNSSDPSCSTADPLLDQENIKVGVLLASKATVQLITNPFIGLLTNRIGYHLPMLAGFCIIFLATILFALSSSYILLLLARSIQGVGGSCLCVAGMGMLASEFTDIKERGSALGKAFSGIALGLVVGATLGSVMYQSAGKSAPFLLLAGMAVLGGASHFLIFKPSRLLSKSTEGTPLLTLMKDPYILIAAGAICLVNQTLATIEATLPIWIMKTMCASNWQLGVVFLPDSLSYLVASNILGVLAHRIGRWLCACFGMLLLGITTIYFGLAQNIYHVMALNAAVGFSSGMVESMLMVEMSSLVDLRHVPVYGSVYAIADAAICIGFSFGPSVGGPIAASLGFPWLMTIIGLINIAYAPLCLFLFSPSRREERCVR